MFFAVAMLAVLPLLLSVGWLVFCSRPVQCRIWMPSLFLAVTKSNYVNKVGRPSSFVFRHFSDRDNSSRLVSFGFVLTAVCLFGLGLLVRADIDEIDHERLVRVPPPSSRAR